MDPPAPRASVWAQPRYVQLAVVAALCVATLLPQGASAHCKIVPRPYVVSVAGHHNLTGPGPSSAAILGAPEWNGQTTMVHAFLSLAPSGPYPWHRHMYADEYIYITKGRGEWHYWPLGADKPVEAEISEGSSIFMPRGTIHRFFNRRADSTLDMVITASPSDRVDQEVYEGDPESSTSPGLPVPLPWTTMCPPGQEPDAHQEL